nr:putative C21orf83B protein form A [Homo sapiens]AAM53516.1 putative C21orf83B protein form B [Homo sapiens]
MQRVARLCVRSEPPCCPQGLLRVVSGFSAIQMYPFWLKPSQNPEWKKRGKSHIFLLFKLQFQRCTDVFIKEDIRSSHCGHQALWTHLSGEFVLDPWLRAAVDSSAIHWCESCGEATGKRSVPSAASLCPAWDCAGGSGVEGRPPVPLSFPFVASKGGRLMASPLEAASWAFPLDCERH